MGLFFFSSLDLDVKNLCRPNFYLKRPSYVAGLGWTCIDFFFFPAEHGSALWNQDINSYSLADWSLLLWIFGMGLEIENRYKFESYCDGWKSSGLVMVPFNLPFCWYCALFSVLKNLCCNNIRGLTDSLLSFNYCFFSVYFLLLYARWRGYKVSFAICDDIPTHIF